MLHFSEGMMISLLIASGIYIVWRSLKRDWPIAFRVRGTSVTFHRGVPIAVQSRIKSFFIENVSLETPLTIYAMKSRTGLLQLQIRGSVDAGTRQQIRNFLIDVL